MRKYIMWLGSAVVVTIIFFTIYTTTQQSLRGSANDPQIQLAEDAVAQLNKDANPTLDVARTVDVAHSLAPFVQIYNKSGKIVAGSGQLNGKAPIIPLGVLKHSEGVNYHFVTWEPDPNVRLAAVAVNAKKYYVVSARSIKEVEAREDQMFRLAALGWVVALIMLALTFWLQKPVHEVYKAPKT